MREIIVYYSFSGHTRRWAEQQAKATGADIAAVEPTAKRGRILAYMKGVLEAIGGKAVSIKPLSEDLSAYGAVTLAGPIWAGRPAPAMNSAADLLPAGCQVRIVLLSSSGSGNATALSERIGQRGCTVTGVENIKSDREK